MSRDRVHEALAVMNREEVRCRCMELTRDAVGTVLMRFVMPPNAHEVGSPARARSDAANWLDMGGK